MMDKIEEIKKLSFDRSYQVQHIDFIEIIILTICEGKYH